MKIIFDLGRLEDPILEGLPKLCEELERSPQTLRDLGEGIATFRALRSMAERESERRLTRPRGSTAARSVVVPLERMPTAALIVFGDACTKLEHAFFQQGLEFGSAFAELLERHAREEYEARGRGSLH